MRSYTIFLVAILSVTAGCGNEERIANLEKQNKELKAAIEKNNAAADYDLQEKCSKDAKAWFRENWSRDKDTAYLDFQNHYNTEKNVCFISVEYHEILDKNSSWSNNRGLWNVSENAKYGDFTEMHNVSIKPMFHSDDRLLTCEVEGKQCKTADEFGELLRPYMTK